MIRKVNDYLAHYGVKGMKWGVRKDREPSFKSPSSLSKYMRKNIGYSEFTTLKSPSQTRKSKKGSCHDQVMLELEELSKMGLKPKARFLIQYNPKTGQGGVTHSYVYFKKGQNVVWFENAWGGREGLHEYPNLRAIEKDMRRFIKEEQGNSEFSAIEFSDWGKHIPGETLQEVVDKSLSTKRR